MDNKKTTMSFLTVFLLIVNFLIAFIMYAFLPEKIAIQWSGIDVSKFVDRLYIFLLPVVSLLLFIWRKPIIGGFLYKCFGTVEKTFLNYVNLAVQILMLTCQIYIVAYCYGLRWKISYIILIELIVFFIGFIKININHS